MEPTREQQGEFEVGFVEMLLAIKAKDLPDHNSLCSLSETVSTFHGKLAALLKYAEGCRDKGFTPGDEVKFG